MWTTIRFFLFLFCFPQFLLAQSNAPEHGPTFIFPELRVRAIGKLDSLSWVSELMARQGLNKRAQYHASLGGRYRLSRNIKLGLHYRGQKNHRNNENWIKEPPIWRFNEEQNDWENIVYPELSLRFLLSPNVRLEFRDNYEFNLLFSQQSLRHRTTLDYFFLTGAEDRRSLYLSNEVVLPTNFARSQINEIWYYVGYRFAVTESQSMGLSLAFVEWTWTESRMFKGEFPAFGYRTTDRALILTLHYVFGFQH